MILSFVFVYLVGLQFGFGFHPYMRAPLIRRISHAQNVVTEISSCDQLDEVLAGSKDKLVVIDYSTTWCGPCKLVSPKFSLLSEKYSQAIFLKCTGDSSDLAALVMKREGVRSVPAFHFWKNAKRIEVIIGAQLQELESNLIALT